MFKLIAAFVMFFVGVSSAYADMTGYDWMKADADLKIIYLSGYITGYQVGEMTGVVSGISHTINNMKEMTDVLKENSVKKNDKIAKDFESCSNIISNNSKAFFASALKLKTESQNKDVTYYIDEINSFLQTYPLCKGKDIGASILPSLMMVWNNSGTKKLNYDAVGTECTK